MPKGGARPGAGAPLGNRNRAKDRFGLAAAAAAIGGAEGGAPGAPRPRFESGKEFALWVLNAPDSEAPIEVKVRAMQALVAAEAKASAAPEKPAVTPAGEAAVSLYAPRGALAVVQGGRE
jgi:hypothetical protein